MDKTGLSRRELVKRYGLGAMGLGMVGSVEGLEASESDLHDWEPTKAQVGGSIRSSHLLFLSSIGGWYPDWRPLPGDISEQTRDALEEMQRRLERAGTTLDNVLKVQVALVDPVPNWQPMTDVYNEFFSAPRPARTYFGVTGFRLRGQLLHFDCIAYIE